MDGTIIVQGSFVVPAAVVVQNIPIVCGVDWMYVYNFTQSGNTPGVAAGVQFYWQRGMPAGSAIVTYRTAAAPAISRVDTLAAGGFTLLDTSVQQPGPAIAITGITAANPPVVATAATPPLGSIIRLNQIPGGAQPQVAGLDLTVTAVTPGVNFTIGNISLVNTVAAIAGFYRVIPFDPIFYPRARAITFVRSAAQAVIYLSVTHNFTVGQRVRLSFPPESNGGLAVWRNYAVLDGVQCTIVNVNVPRAGNEPTNALGPNNIVVNVDTSLLGAWDVFGPANNEAYPDSAQVPFTPAAVIPEGEDSAFSLTTPLPQVPLDVFGQPLVGAPTGLLSDATTNLAIVGMQLGTGGNGGQLGAAITGPAGTAAADVMFWRAGKSTSGGL